MSTTTIARAIANGQNIPENNPMERIGTVETKGTLKTEFGPVAYHMSDETTVYFTISREAPFTVNRIDNHGRILLEFNKRWNYTENTSYSEWGVHYQYSHVYRDGNNFSDTTDNCQKKVYNAIIATWLRFVDENPIVIEVAKKERLEYEAERWTQEITDLKKQLEEKTKKEEEAYIEVDKQVDHVNSLLNAEVA